MNNKRKGTNGEHRCMAILEAAGYKCTRAGASLGLFDVIAIGANEVRCIQVKVNCYLSAVEREQLELVAVPPNVTKEYWRFRDRKREPSIERL